MSSERLIHNGTTKRVIKPAGREDVVWVEFHDNYSLCDWDPMPDKIANKGRAQAVVSAFLFEYLSDPDSWKGLPASPAMQPFRADWLDRRWNHLIYDHVLREHGAPTSYRGLVNLKGHSLMLKEAAVEDVLLQEAPYLVTRPDPCFLLSSLAYHYPPLEIANHLQLVPISLQYHFSIQPNSALESRLLTNTENWRAVGLSHKPVPGQLLERPILEYKTHLEPEPRLIGLQEALLTSGLSAGQFEEMLEFAYCSALLLHALLALRQIELISGCLEFAVSTQGLFLCGRLGPADLRFHYGKQDIMQRLILSYYEKSGWLYSVNKLKAKASAEQRCDWRNLCLESGATPEPLPHSHKVLIDQLYGALANRIVGREILQSESDLDVLTREIDTVVQSNQEVV